MRVPLVQNETDDWGIREELRGRGGAAAATGGAAAPALPALARRLLATETHILVCCSL